MLVKKLSIHFYLFMIPLFFVTPAHAILPEKDTGNLGEVRQSILSLLDFQRIYGDGWVLMDGRNIEDTQLFGERLWRLPTLPDARGVFLRSKNHDQNSEIGCPEGDQDCGAYQSDEFKSHNHTGTTHAGNAKFYRTVGSGSNVTDSYNNHQAGWSGACGQPLDRTDPHWSNSDHTHAIPASGGSETRPRNITVNTFIKVNRTPESQQSRVFADTLQQIPRRILENDQLRRVIRQMVNEAVQRRQNH